MYLGPNRCTELRQAGIQSLIEFVQVQLEALEQLAALS